MALTINAKIIDLTSDVPKNTDVFFIDSNIWYQVGYSNASIDAIPYQVKIYPNYITDASTIGSQLHKSTLTFAEIAHTIERSERQIFNTTGSSIINTKDFRHNYPAERQNVLQEIENAWNIADQFTNGFSIEANVTNAMIRLV